MTYLPPSTPMVKLAIGAALAVAFIVLVWVFWPTPGPSPAEDALKAQNEALIKRNEELAAEAATRSEEAQQLREEANRELETIPVIRSRRRAARADDARRRDAITATPDRDVAAALADQHRRTREAIRHVRAEAGSPESDSGPAQPR